MVQDPLAMRILEGDFPEGSKVLVDARVSGDALEFRAEVLSHNGSWGDGSLTETGGDDWRGRSFRISVVSAGTWRQTPPRSPLITEVRKERP